MQTATTLRALILSERILPGRLFTPHAPATTARADLETHARTLHMVGNVYADGPRGATLLLAPADIDALAPHRQPYDFSGYEQQAKATIHIVDDLRALMPGYRVSGRDGKIIVRVIR